MHNVRSNSPAGFSLVELLIATAITFGLGAAVFQLFHHNERVFRDQALILEMQQTARMVNSAIADDIRMAGQAMPRLDDIVLPGSGASRLNLRAGFTATETVVTAPVPFSVAIGAPVNLPVESASGFSASRQVFLWNEEGWARAFIDTVYTSTHTLLVTPTAASAAAITFTTPPVISLDEAVAIYRDASANAVRRTTATNTENPVDPSWAPANEIATNVTGLAFIYFDAAGTPLDPSVPGFSSKVASIESRVIVRPSSPLSNGSLPSFTLSIRSFPRNLSYR
jgi:Tfp pilus assembly protein PilW